jgi:hypothetical protein
MWRAGGENLINYAAAAGAIMPADLALAAVGAVEELNSAGVAQR